MSNKHIENLTVRLLQALDKNYDVVNMDAVLSVIAALESTKITKEQLEATRLAKYINLFRRRTKSEQLAKRAKSLLKRWREMVGMQQRPLSSCNELIRNESATSSNFQENINLVEGISSLQQNSAVSYTPTTRNVYSSGSTTDKTFDHNKSTGKTPIKTVPTSFSNVLSGFSGTSTDRNNPPSFTNFNVANGPSARRKNCNLKRSADSSAFPEAFAFEQQSNSIGNCVPVTNPTKISLNTEPIIIDIEDSNSGSNLMEPAPRLQKESEIIAVGSSVEKPSKHKKTKKDKKRSREKDHFQDLSAPLVVIDAESSLSQQSNLRKLVTTGLADKDLPSITDEKLRNENLMVTNMSEILSLSNSSMSSVFPTSSVGATKNVFSQQSSRLLSESDLSFAGKFAQQSGSALSPIASTTATTSESKNNYLPYNDASEVKMTAGISGTNNTFQPFIGTGYISNDSASNSRHSTFEIMNCNSQGNKTQIKRPESDSSFPMHRPKIATSKDSVIERQQPSPMTGTIPPQANLNTPSVAATIIPEQKVPKKRGRKKGSKGIDSLIAKDTSLSSQMLIQSLGSGAKKVKTTKELYAEMQNRKLGVSTPTTPSHWAGAQSQTFVRRDSFCSEPSLHSPRTFDACSTNATVSTIATSSTPEKISLQTHTVDIDSGSDSLISGGQSRESGALVPTSERADNFQNSSSSKFLSEQSKKQSTSNMLTAVESQLQELAGKLPVVPSIEQIEMKAAKDTVPCTCKILEFLPKQVEQDSEVAAVGDLLSLDALKTSNASALKDDSNEPVITISVGRMDAANSLTSTTSANVKEPTIKSEQEKPKRSIFDLDFEDDEDPLQTLIAEVAAASGVSKTEDDVTDSYEAATTPKENDYLDQTETIKDKELEVQQFEVGHEEQQLPLQETAIPPPAFPTYKIEEDEACLAKQRFELQVQKIANFHIRALHNFYIPNVNGNWDNALRPKASNKGINADCGVETLLPDGSNVVPKYCSFDSEEYIKKDLRDVAFDPNFKPTLRPKAVEQLFYAKPFLGVSRCLENLKSSHRKTRKHRKAFEPKDTNVESMQKIDKIEIVDESGALLGNGSLDRANDGDKSHSLCSETISNPPLKLLLNDITINVEETLAPIVKENTPTEAPTLLAIASNVNFNNNQIENNITGEDAAAQKSCGNKFEEETASMDLNAQDDRITFSGDNGDIKNNNNFNEKLEESSCESHSSLKQTQKSINLKLRKHRRQIIEQEQNSSKSYSKRKRRRKKSSSRGKRQKIKCIRIAINGGITTQRHIKVGNISDDDDENDESESNSYVSDSDGSKSNAVNDSELEDETSETSDVEKDLDYAFKSGESEWDHGKDAAVSEHEGDDEEDYEYDDEEELDEEDEYSGEFHEVVTRDISPSSESGNNHIVLTIKKTPSKTNSPISTLPPISPVITGVKSVPGNTTSADKIDEKVEDTLKQQLVVKGTGNDVETPKDTMNATTTAAASQSNPNTSAANRTAESIAYSDFLQKHKLKRPLFKRKRRLLRRKFPEYKPFRFPDESKKNDDSHERVFKKLHQQLFFPHELFVETTGGSKEPMFDMSSCSSSCAELSEYEDDSLSEKDVKSDKDVVDTNISSEKIFPNNESDGNHSSDECSTADNSDEAVEETSGVEEEHLKVSDSKIGSEERVNIDVDHNEILPEDNNGLLVSFNNICMPSSALEVSTDSVAKILKCDEICSKDLINSEDYGNSIGHGIKADSRNETIVNNEIKSQTIPRLEYITGVRAVDEDVNDEDGNNCSGAQQFREWHQLLQLRSYNDELLTVLPYVVLD